MAGCVKRRRFSSELEPALIPCHIYLLTDHTSVNLQADVPIGVKVCVYVFHDGGGEMVIILSKSTPNFVLYQKSDYKVFEVISSRNSLLFMVRGF